MSDGDVWVGWMCILPVALVAFIIGFIVGAWVMYDAKQEETTIEMRLDDQQMRVDDQQMRLDILVDELKHSKIGSEINWDRL